MVANPKTAPNSVVLGINIKMEAINSIIPEAILPNGSAPNFVKINTDSSAAVNLKYNVCNKITTATIFNIHVKTEFFIFLLSNL